MDNGIHSLSDQTNSMIENVQPLNADPILIVERFEENLALLSVIMLKSDQIWLSMAEQRPDDYWSKIELLVSPYILQNSNFDCKTQFYKLLEAYKYILTNLTNWPPHSIQRLWPFFTIFHSFPDLTPFCEDIIKLNIQYNFTPKSFSNWVTGCDLIAFNNSFPFGFSPVPPVTSFFKPRSLEELVTSPKQIHTEEVDSSSLPSTSEDKRDKQLESNGCEPCQSDTASAFDIKTIVKDLVSKLNVSKDNSCNISSTNCVPVLQSCDTLDTEDTGSNSKSSNNETFCEASSVENLQDLKLEDQKLIVDCVAHHMKINEVFLCFQKSIFWAIVAEDVATQMNRNLFDVKSIFCRYIQKYMDILKHRKQFYCDLTFIEIMWPLFSHIHQLDITHFLPSFEVEDYNQAKEEINSF